MPARKPPKKPKWVLANPKVTMIEGRRNPQMQAEIKPRLEFHEKWMEELLKEGRKKFSGKQLAACDLQRTVLLDFLEQLKVRLNPGFNEIQLKVIDRIVKILEKPLDKMPDRELETVYRLTCSLKL